MKGNDVKGKGARGPCAMCGEMVEPVFKRWEGQPPKEGRRGRGPEMRRHYNKYCSDRCRSLARIGRRQEGLLKDTLERSEP